MFYYSREEKEPMTEVMLLQELLNFILAGSETTSIMFSFMLLRIFDSAEVHAKLMEEIEKHLKDPRNMTFDELKKLKYLDWIQYETIRLDNSGEILFDRIAARDTFLADIPIRKGTLFNFLVQSRFYDDSVF